MNYKIEKIKVKSSDGVHMLSGKIYIPEGEIKGIFHLVHGMTEYIDRFENTMSTVAKYGYICAGYDNLGHGKTVRDVSELGFIAEKKGYDFLIKDVKVFADKLKGDYPNLPYILMGHSMGSFIARLAVKEFSDEFSKLIICGTGGPKAVATVAPMLTSIIKLFKGARAYSPFLENLAFGSYNKRFENETKYDWLTTDRTVIEKYIKDTYCNYSFTVSALCDLVTLNRNCNQCAWFSSISKDLPILIISGSDDPVGDYGKGVKKVYNKLLKTGHNNVALKLYEGCRHEIHNDTCAEEVLRDILKFVKLI